MEPGNVAYICDRKQCEDCSFPLCHRTLDINHAVNFTKFGDYYMEKMEEDEAEEEQETIKTSLL